MGHQLLDFRVLGQQDFRRAVLFLRPRPARLGFRDDPSYLGLDDISVTPIPTPNFQSAIQAGGAISLSWSASSGLKYQLQYATNLAQAQWCNLGNVAICTNGTGVVSTSIGPDEARFYRVLLLP